MSAELLTVGGLADFLAEAQVAAHKIQIPRSQLRTILAEASIRRHIGQKSILGCETDLGALTLYCRPHPGRMENAMITQKVIHTTIAILAAAASLTFSTGAQARPTLCEERATQWCHGQVDADGNYLHYGAPGWNECLEDYVASSPECQTPPEGGIICIINGIFTEC